MWVKGQPTNPGWYLLEFSGGDRFVVVKAFYDEESEGELRLEDQNSNMGCYINDVVDVIVAFLPIPEPC